MVHHSHDRHFTVSFDFNAGTDDSLVIFQLSNTTQSSSMFLKTFELYSDVITPAPLKLGLIRMSTAGAGGTTASWEKLDPGDTSKGVGHNVFYNRGLPGTNAGLLFGFIWDQVAPLQKSFEEGQKIMVPGVVPPGNQYLGLVLATNPNNANFGGSLLIELE